MAVRHAGAVLALCFFAVAVFAEAVPGPNDAEPGVVYGKSDAPPLPKTLLFSISAEAVAADAAAWKERGIDGFFIDNVASDWSSDIWATDGAPWTIGEEDASFQKVKAATAACKKTGSEAFLKVAFSHPFNWFDDAAWPQIINNFRQFGIFARGSGCTGVALDIEYIGQQYDFEWEGYRYNGYTRQDLIQKIRDRMTGALSAMYDAFPEMVFLTLPEEAYSLGTQIHAAWIEEAARRNAPGGIHYFMESTYRCPNVRYLFGQVWADIETMEHVLSPAGLKYWREKCSIASGVWPFGLSPEALYDAGMPLNEFRQEWAGSLMVSKRYNWIFADHALDQLFGRKLEVYGGKFDIAPYQKIIADKQIITSPEFEAIARDLRDLKSLDYAGRLGLVPVPRFRVPQGSPVVELITPKLVSAGERTELDRLTSAYYGGTDVNVSELFKPLRHWMVIGPFPNGSKMAGHDTIYPPEQKLDLSAEYQGINGKVRWMEHTSATPAGSVELGKLFTPNEHACAYALCYVHATTERNVQLRIGANDSVKVWLGKQLVYNDPREDTAFVDRDVIPVTLPKGTTPMLIKVCNGLFTWDFVVRITDDSGHVAEDLAYSVIPD